MTLSPKHCYSDDDDIKKGVVSEADSTAQTAAESAPTQEDTTQPNESVLIALRKRQVVTVLMNMANIPETEVCGYVCICYLLTD